jgi:hypothetical protein
VAANSEMAGGPESQRCKRVALLVVHGIGTQKEDETRNRIVEGLEIAYGPPSFSKDGIRTFPVAEPGSVPSEIRVYEAFWAEVLSDEKVRGSFDIAHLQQLIWFPYLNWKYVKNFADEYPRPLVMTWTFVLFMFGGVITSAYFAANFLLNFFQALVDSSLRETRACGWLAARYGAVPVVGAMLTKTHKPDPKAPTRSALDWYLDRTFADIFNYADAAGNAAPKVPGAERDIYDVFKKTLAQAVADGCTDVQILGHSLGSVITYHALTKYRDETSALIALTDEQDGRPRLTHVFTIGSPLEKFRFFWPKLIAVRTRAEYAHFEWYNFRSPGDIVAGPLRRYEWGPTIKNFTVNGAGGILTAHTAYRIHPSFLEVIGPALASQPLKTHPHWSHTLGRRLRAVSETLAVPALLIFLAAFGGYYMYAVGWVFGVGIGKLSSLSVGAASMMGFHWVFDRVLNDWSPIVLGWFIAVMSLPGGLAIGYLKASEMHREHWRDGFELDRRSTVDVIADKPEPPRSVYRERAPWGFLLLQFVNLGAIGWVGFLARSNTLTRSRAWLIIMVLMAAFAVVAGRGITGYWRGVLIDSRYKMSLSRLQFMVWTLVILSAIVTAALTNGIFGAVSPLSIQVPQELWVLLGISSVSAVAAPAVLRLKDDRKPDPKERDRIVTAVEKNDHVQIDNDRSTMVLRNASPSDARWGDLLKGDETGTASTVDLGKLQMFFFTFVLALGYGVAIAQMFDSTSAVTSLPVVDSTVNTLLGISHSGYLASKGVTRSREAEPDEDGEA